MGIALNESGILRTKYHYITYLGENRKNLTPRDTEQYIKNIEDAVGYDNLILQRLIDSILASGEA
jgi:hypothetical protein